MDENQNYGYQEGNYNTQGGGDQGQPYENQQYAQNQNAYGQAPQQPQYNQAPYGAQQYNQAPYGAQQQYNQAPYGAQQQYNQAPYGQPVKAVVYDAVPDRTSGIAVAALICGILGLIFFWIPVVDIGLCLAGLICGIVAIVKQYNGKGMAIAGLIISIIDCILTLLFMYFFIFFGMMLS